MDLSKGDPRCCSYCITMDDWTLCPEKGQIDAIYSDFEKAFDKVPHKD